jgi:APA family basic amino acid/polyamine antiporter
MTTQAPRSRPGSEAVSSGLFRRKSVTALQEEAASDHSLKRALGALNLTALGIGAIIGTGIFVLTGTVAAQNAGPAVVLSFVLAGVASVFAALCYSEFASLVPMAGSAYTYGYATLGEFVAWIIGWDLVLEYALAATTVAIGWSGYVVSFLADLGIHIPAHWQAARGTVVTLADGTTTTAILNLPAVFIIAVVTTLLVVGIKESASVNNAIVFIKLAVVLLFIALAAPHVNPDNWHPFIPPNTGAREHFGFSGVVAGAAIVFFAYIGFDSVTTTAQEAKNPQRDMPIGIIGSLIICTVLYIIVAAIATGVMRYTELDVPDPIAKVADAAGLGVFATLIKIGAIAGLTSVILVQLLGQSRVFYSMSRDGLLPPFIRRVHPRFRTPYITSIVTGIGVAIPAAILPVRDAAKLVSIGTLLAFVIVCTGVLVLRIREPNLHRPFKTPLIWFVAPMGALSAAYLMAHLDQETWIRLLVWFVVGLVIYFTYSRAHSLLAARRKQ